jgi:hypothetical protein
MHLGSQLPSLEFGLLALHQFAFQPVIPDMPVMVHESIIPV